MHNEGDHRINPYEFEGWRRHALIVSKTAPVFLAIAIFFLFRWVLIGGDRAGEFFRTAVAFTAIGVALVILSVAARRPLENDEQP